MYSCCGMPQHLGLQTSACLCVSSARAHAALRPAHQQSVNVYVCTCARLREPYWSSVESTPADVTHCPERRMFFFALLSEQTGPSFVLHINRGSGFAMASRRLSLYIALACLKCVLKPQGLFVQQQHHRKWPCCLGFLPKPTTARLL